MASDFVLPPACAVCGKMGPIICGRCCQQLPRVVEPLCHRCGRQVRHEGGLCQNCASSKATIAQARAPLLFADKARVVIHRYKYDGLFSLADPLSEILFRGWPAWSRQVDGIVPVPLHKRRQRSRGFNQSALLAHRLGDQVALPVWSDALRRTRHTKPQVDLGPRERQLNVKGAFAAESDRFIEQHVLLIDDVFTTGATLTEAAKTLLDAGAARVSAYCLARTNH